MRVKNFLDTVALKQFNRHVVVRLPSAHIHRCIALSLFTLSLLSPTNAVAESINLSQVLQQVLREQPSIALAELNESLKRTDDIQREAMLDTQWGVALNGSDEKNPSTSPFGANITNIAVASANISKPFSDGSLLTATMSYSRVRMRYPGTTLSTFQASLNPVYENKIDLIYSYPLWQGRGNPAYHQQAIINEKGVESAHWNVEIQHEQLLAQAIGMYYQLAANEISVRIAEDAMHRASQLLQYQRKRESFGLVEAADRLQTEALVATRKAGVVQANAALQSSRTALSRLLLKPVDASLQADLLADAVQAKPLLADDQQLLAQAKQRRPLFRMLRAQTEAVNAAETILVDQFNPQLNVIGQLGSRALTGAFPTTTNESFDLRNRFVGISLELKDSIEKNSTKVAVAQNTIQQDQLVLQRWQALENTKTDIANARTELNNAKNNYQALQQRAKAEGKKYQAEMKRYREGRSDTVNIVQFSGELRNAELQAAMQKINIDLSRARLHLASGYFLD